MNQPVDTRNIHQRLNSVMKIVKGVNKENKKVNGQYTFVSHDAVTAKLHDPIAENGILITSSCKSILQDGNRTSVMMTVSFINIDNPLDRIEVDYPGYGIDPQDKGPGKAISYATKLSLLKTFMLETGEDVERDNIDYAPTPKTEPKSNVINEPKSNVINDEQYRILESLINNNENLKAGILKYMKIKYKTDDLKNMPLEAYSAAMKWITEQEKAQMQEAVNA